MKKKNKIIALLIITITILGLSVFKISEDINKKNVTNMRIERYRNTIEYLTENLDSFEKMCEYDLEHCKEYNSASGTELDIYYVPEVGEPFEKEREALFSELGIYDGFDYGWIYCDNNTISFYDRGEYWMHLEYVKNGNYNYDEKFDKIGAHFILEYYYVPTPNG